MKAFWAFLTAIMRIIRALLNSIFLGVGVEVASGPIHVGGPVLEICMDMSRMIKNTAQAVKDIGHDFAAVGTTTTSPPPPASSNSEEEIVVNENEVNSEIQDAAAAAESSESSESSESNDDETPTEQINDIIGLADEEGSGVELHDSSSSSSDDEETVTAAERSHASHKAKSSFGFLAKYFPKYCNEASNAKALEFKVCVPILFEASSAFLPIPGINIMANGPMLKCMRKVVEGSANWLMGKKKKAASSSSFIESSEESSEEGDQEGDQEEDQEEDQDGEGGIGERLLQADSDINALLIPEVARHGEHPGCDAPTTNTICDELSNADRKDECCANICCSYHAYEEHTNEQGSGLSGFRCESRSDTANRPDVIDTCDRPSEDSPLQVSFFFFKRNSGGTS